MQKFTSIMDFQIKEKGKLYQLIGSVKY